MRAGPDHVGWAFAAWFVFCLLLSLAVLGFMGWAIFEVVVWLTRQSI